MKLNEHVRIRSGSTPLELVPYEAHHVEKYHNWMEDEELRRLTGSERLTLAEEFEMQSKWRQDEDKLTFIVLERHSETKEEEVSHMVGDVNLFIDLEEKAAEVEIMLAEPSARGKGWAREAVSLMLSYALNNLPLSSFCVKIKGDNVASQTLFQKLGFSFETRSDVFDESTYRLPVEKFEQLKNYIVESNAKILKYL